MSLVVPVKDEAASIEKLLHSISQQVRLPDEVVIVDGGSADGTVAVARRLVGRRTGYRIIQAGAATPGRGRNVGIAAANHDWIALTDAGIDLDPHWLDRLVRVVEHDESIEVVYGSMAAARCSYFERCAELAYVSPVTPTPVGPMRPRFIASCLLRKDVWERVGGFPDLRAAEDLLFMRRVDALGCRVAVAPEACVTWHLQPNLALTFRRFRRYSRHNVLAGQQPYWHHGLARQYLIGAGVVVMARAARRSPVPLLASAGCLRVARTLWRRREGRGLAWVLRPDRFATVGAILMVLDIATFLGWAEAYVPCHRRRACG